MMTENEYLPFRAINVFIEEEFLHQTLEYILRNFNTLPKEDQISFVNFFKEYANILGFRNPMRAPLPLQTNAYVKAFEEKDEVIPFTLSTWAKLKIDFADQVKSWLESEGWKNLSLDRKFEETEGFIKAWPEGLSFDKLNKDFKKAHKDLDYDENDLILMVVWISGQLPDEEFSL
jgi:hypothetical protein